MTRARERAIKMYWKMAKEKCPFQTEELVNGYLEGFIDCAELFEEEDKLTLTKYARIIIDKKDECIEELEKENAELKSIAEFQQSSNMKRHFEIQELKKKNKELDVFLDAGTTFNKALNSTNKALEEERDKYRNMVFDQKDLLTKAKEIIKNCIHILKHSGTALDWKTVINQAEQFLKEIEK